MAEVAPECRGEAVSAALGVYELEFLARSQPADPWTEIRLDVEFVDPDDRVFVVPAFWAGGRIWRVRYSSRVPGVHRYRTVARDGPTAGLENQSGAITVTAYHGGNQLLLRGAPMIAPDHRHLMHGDGTPFFWLADTWWSALTERFRWPGIFSDVTADRAEKGFTVIQLVAGLVPEFPLFSPLMGSEGGQPWQDHGAGPINPNFYDIPDLKIQHLVANGMVPCIVGGWGSWLGVLGREKVLEHWRYLVARYAAYPVVWCIAGEVEMPTPFAPIDGGGVRDGHVPGEREANRDAWIAQGKAQAAVWEQASLLVGEIDPFDRLRTVHPCPGSAWSSSGAFESRDAFDIDMLQTGHSGLSCVPDSLTHTHASLAHGDKPVIVGECSYEGIAGGSWAEVQRFLFWSHMLSGTAGHTYGTMPLSTFSSRADHYVPPSGASSADWEDAMLWAGATHLGIGRKILELLRWWELRPAPAAVDSHAGPEDWFRPYAASHPDGSLLVYLPGISQSAPSPNHTISWVRRETSLRGLVPGECYNATYINPRTGTREPRVRFRTQDGSQAITDLVRLSFMHFPRQAPTWEDWILLVRPERAVSSVTLPPWP